MVCQKYSILKTVNGIKQSKALEMIFMQPVNNSTQVISIELVIPLLVKMIVSALLTMRY